MEPEDVLMSQPLTTILSQKNPVLIITTYFFNIYFNITSHLCKDLPSRLFPSSFSTKILYAFLIFLIMQSSPASCQLLPCMSKYSPQYPVLIYHQLTFFPYGERPSFIPIQNKRFRLMD